MAIEKNIGPFDVSIADNPDETPIDVEVAPPEGFPVEGEGDIEVDLGGDSDTSTEGVEFDANLAEHMSDEDLNKIASELCGDFQNDQNSRSDWELTYKHGLDLLGLKIEERTEPWDGACGVFHPLITEAVIKYQAEAMTETFPASGPVKTQIVGKITPMKEQQAGRVRDDMNYWLTTKIKDYRSEHERLLWSQSLCGSAFKKVYADPITAQPRSMFVPAEDFIVAFGCTDLWSANRFTHIMKKTKNDIKKLQVSGFYRDIELGDPAMETTDLKQKKQKISGEKPSMIDDRFLLLEIHVDLDLPGFEDPDGIERPYVVTINKSNSTVLSIYRNWKEDDALKGKRMHFVHYPFVPGFGFYGYGWVHLLGNSGKAATSILRQLVDAGTLSNLPGGLKTRGLRIKSDDQPISPGEWRDVDVPSGRIQDNIMALPYKEPSATLYNLLILIVDEGRRLAGITDMKIADLSSESPVGTTLAILERTLKVMNAIQARVHAAMKEEFEILVEIIRSNTPQEYAFEPEGDVPAQIKQEDYSDKVITILPVSDPNATTMAQRIVQYQAALQLASQAPDLYNRPQLHRDMLTILGVRDAAKILPLDEDMKPCDPVTENMAMLTGKPVKVFMFQDHDSHIVAHMSMAQDPKILAMVGQSPTAGMVKASFAAHVTEHLAYSYRTKLEQELGTPLPEPGTPMPPQVEANLSALIAKAAQKLLQKDLIEAEAQKIVAQQGDPVIQIQQREVAAKEAEVVRKVLDDIRRYSTEELKIVADFLGKAQGANVDSALAGLAHGVEVTQSAADRIHEKELLDAKNASAEAVAKSRPKPTGKGK